jgi:hypothetical protein
MHLVPAIEGELERFHVATFRRHHRLMMDVAVVGTDKVILALARGQNVVLWRR